MLYPSSLRRSGGRRAWRSLRVLGKPPILEESGPFCPTALGVLDFATRLEQVRIHGQRAVFEVVNDAIRPQIFASGPVGDKQWKEMLLGRMCARGVRRTFAIGDQRIRVVRAQCR